MILTGALLGSVTKEILEQSIKDDELSAPTPDTFEKKEFSKERISKLRKASRYSKDLNIPLKHIWEPEEYVSKHLSARVFGPVGGSMAFVCCILLVVVIIGAIKLFFLSSNDIAYTNAIEAVSAPAPMQSSNVQPQPKPVETASQSAVSQEQPIQTNAPKIYADISPNYTDSDYGFMLLIPEEYNFDTYGTWCESNLEDSDADFLLQVLDGETHSIANEGNSILEQIFDESGYESPTVNDEGSDNFTYSGYTSINQTNDYVYYFHGRVLNDAIVVVAFSYPEALRSRYDLQVESVVSSMTALSGYTRQQEGDELDEETNGVEYQPDYTYEDDTLFYTTAEHGLVLRSGPSTDYAKLDSIPYNSSVYLRGEADGYDDWRYIDFDGEYGWVNFEYLVQADEAA